MSEDTVVLPSLPAKPARLPLVPLLGGAALAASAAALVLFLQWNERGGALDAATAQNAQLTSALGAARQHTLALERELAAKNAELAGVLAAKMPVEITFRVGEPGTGFVAVFENRSSAPLALTVEPRRPSSGEYGKLELTVAPQSSGTLAEKQGWEFRSGDTLNVTSGDFHPVALVVP